MLSHENENEIIYVVGGSLVVLTKCMVLTKCVSVRLFPLSRGGSLVVLTKCVSLSITFELC